jgi:hypothetical protein
MEYIPHIAIRNIYPLAINIHGDFEALDNDGNSIVLDEILITAEISRLQAEYDSKQYARDRAEAYPSLTDQADMLWHSIDEGVFGVAAKESPFYLANKKVKDDNPKNL